MSLKKQLSKKKKRTLLLVSLSLLLCLAAGGTLAYLLAHTTKAVNTFTPSKVTTTVEEDFENNVKNNVVIRNTGDTDAFIRAAVVVTWQNEEGKALGQVPVEGTDYIITWSGLKENGGWVKGNDSFYYYQNSVAGDPDGEGNHLGGATSILFTDCKLAEGIVAPKEGYFLNVEIIGSGIQNVPEEVVEKNWSNEKVTVKVVDGKLSITDK